MTAIECQLQHLLKQHQYHHTEVQQLEHLENKVQELGRAIMDCLKRRDGQLRSLIQSSGGATSTAFQPHHTRPQFLLTCTL